jgi:hypothetical protein
MAKAVLTMQMDSEGYAAVKYVSTLLPALPEDLGHYSSWISKLTNFYKASA